MQVKFSIKDIGFLTSGELPFSLNALKVCLGKNYQG